MEQAAGFLDSAYEKLQREADQQRAATGQRGHSIWDRVRLEVSRLPTWIGRLPWLNWPDIRPPRPWWPFPSVPRFPWNPGDWFRPRWPVVPLPDISPIDPDDWIDDIVIGIGIGSLIPILRLVPDVFGPNGEVGGVRTPPVPIEAPQTPAPHDPTPTPVPDGPHEFSQAKLVNIATGDNGLTQPATVDGSTWNAPGQCILWVDRWLDRAGLPGGLPGGTTPFEQFESLNALRVEEQQLRPGDVFQRAVPNGWSSNPHTAIVQSYDESTGTVTLIEGNVPAGSGQVGVNSYAIADLQRTGCENRFYRLGQVE